MERFAWLSSSTHYRYSESTALEGLFANASLEGTFLVRYLDTVGQQGLSSSHGQTVASRTETHEQSDCVRLQVPRAGLCWPPEQRHVDRCV